MTATGAIHSCITAIARLHSAPVKDYTHIMPPAATEWMQSFSHNTRSNTSLTGYDRHHEPASGTGVIAPGIRPGQEKGMKSAIVILSSLLLLTACSGGGGGSDSDSSNERSATPMPATPWATRMHYGNLSVAYIGEEHVSDPFRHLELS